MRMNVFNFLRRDCAAALISDIFVLTSASCFQGVNFLTQYFEIKAGVHRLENTNDSSVQTRLISHLIAHPNYTNQGYRNDLALVRVSPPFDLTGSGVATITLSKATTVERMNLTTVSWTVWNQVNSTGVILPLQQVTVEEKVPCTEYAPTQLCTIGKAWRATTSAPLWRSSFLHFRFLRR